jgi:hypothetical protein
MQKFGSLVTGLSMSGGFQSSYHMIYLKRSTPVRDFVVNMPFISATFQDHPMFIYRLLPYKQPLIGWNC